MGKKYPEINEQHQGFIKRQQMYFIATVPKEGRINLSPKGIDSLRILDGNRVAWLNLTGSGNETAAHLLEDDRMTIMFCAFEGDPKILRLYGHARAVHQRDSHWEELIALFPETNGARQVIDMQVDLVGVVGAVESVGGFDGGGPSVVVQQMLIQVVGMLP